MGKSVKTDVGRMRDEAVGRRGEEQKTGDEMKQRGGDGGVMATDESSALTLFLSLVMVLGGLEGHLRAPLLHPILSLVCVSL